MSDQAPPASTEERSLIFTVTLFDKLPPVLSRALQLAAIPYWFDLPMLAALRGPDDADGRTSKIIDWLSERSFVSKLPDDRYTLNSDIRDLLRTRWTRDRQGLAEVSRRLVDYCAERAAQASGPEADEWAQARLYHLLGADADAGIVELQKALAQAESSHRLAVAERLVEVAAEQSLFLEPRHTVWIEYLRACSLQLHNRWAESRSALQKLLAQPDLPTELRPRVQAALAAALVETGDWVQAIELYQQARTLFETLGLYDQVAVCQLGLGYAHMDLGLNIWGQRESRPTPPPSFRQTLMDLVTLPVRLPILLYVLVGARREASASFPAWLTLARDVDWTIARLLVQASRWYRLALEHMEAAHNADGILRAKDSLARLYLALGYPAGAAELYREIILRPDIATGEYQIAYARAWLGLTLLRLGQVEEAVKTLEAAAPVLADYGAKTHAGRAYSHLAEAQLSLGATDQAIASYATAIELMPGQENLTRVTDVAHNLEAIAAQTDVKAESRTQATQLAASVVQRRYQTRYSHPALNLFRDAAIILLAVMLVVTLYLSIGAETSFEIVAGTTLIAKSLGEPSSIPSPFGEPSLGATQPITPTLDPTAQVQQSAPSSQSLFITLSLKRPVVIRPNVVLNSLLVGLIGYLVTYTLVGLYVLSRTSLRQFQERPDQDVWLDSDALARGPERIAWATATGLVRADRTLVGRRLPAHSRTILFGPAGQRIVLTGHTAWYPALADQMEQRVPHATPRVKLSSDWLGGPAGILSVSAIIGLIAFVLVGYLAPAWSSALILGGRYVLADVRWLLYLGLGAALIAKLMIDPMRLRALVYPRSRLPWGVLAAGVGLVVISSLSLLRYHFLQEHLDVLGSLLGTWLAWQGAWAIWAARVRVPGQVVDASGLRAVQSGKPVYPALLRWSALAVAAMTLAIALPPVAADLASYHALTQNTERVYIGSAQKLEAYTHALQYNPRDVSALNGRGVTYSQAGVWDKAIADYTASLKINPRQPSIQSNLGLAFTGQALDLDDKRVQERDVQNRLTLQRQEQDALLYAIEAYTRALELVRGNNVQYRLRRSVVYSMLGQFLGTVGQTQEALESYQLALRDLEHALELDPRSADAYSGIGWVHFNLAEISGAAARVQAEYELALDGFSRATALDPRNPNAYNWLGWTWLKLGNLQANQNDKDAMQASYQIALEAYLQASQLAPNDPQYIVSVGNARWLVSINSSACNKPSATPDELAQYIGTIQSAIAEIESGVKLAERNHIALEPSIASYYGELGQLAYILSNCRGQDPLARLQQSIAYYDRAIAADPSNAKLFQLRGRLTYVLGLRQPQDPAGQQRRLDAFQRALQDLSNSLVISPDNHEALYWRSFVSSSLSDAQSQDANGLAQRENYLASAVSDRRRMLELAQDAATRAEDARQLAAAYLKLGWVHYLQGKYHQAADEAAKGLEYDASNSILFFNKGVAELALGDAERAARTYDAGVVAVKKLSPDQRKAKLEEAIADLQNLLRQHPDLENVAAPILQMLQAAK